MCLSDVLFAQPEAKRPFRWMIQRQCINSDDKVLGCVDNLRRCWQGLRLKPVLVGHTQREISFKFGMSRSELVNNGNEIES